MQRRGRNSTTGEEDDGNLRFQGAPRGLLQFYALLSIARKPMRGYDLMKEIEAKTEGAWRPGPGAVYPVLQKLAKQGYIAVRKKSGDGPTQVLYEITPSGLKNIAAAKKAMGSSTQRLSVISSLFVDLMESDDIVKFVLNAVEMQISLVNMLIESDKSGLSEQDKLFVLRQYSLNLERELGRATASIREMEARNRPRKAVAGRAV